VGVVKVAQAEEGVDVKVRTWTRSKNLTQCPICGAIMGYEELVVHEGECRRIHNSKEDDE
jgi:hypothetical protein